MSAELKAILQDQGQRLNSLYTITTKEGKKVPFRMNWAQQELWENLSLNNLVLKGRQFGISTLVQLIQLDTCLFNAGTSCGVIAHDRESAEELFHRNIKSPYEDLPESIRNSVTATSDTARQFRFSNGSTIRVGTSMRSGTVQLLHVSEFGKICARWPDKAREIVTGSFEAVPVGHGIKFVESTAEGREGYFYDYCQEARALQDAGKELGEQEFKFFFFPWWKHPEYRSRDTSTVITAERTAYFDELEKVIGEPIPLARRLWYVGKAKTLGEDMLREYPSTPDEAFAVTIQGAYYANEMREARKSGRITKVPYQTGALVHTWWDLGMDDMTAIWFVQRIGRELHVIDYYEANGEGLAHYAKVLQDRGYLYGAHIGPYDLEVRELGGGDGEGITRKETARRLGINFTVAPGPGKISQSDGIQAVRNLLSISWFDEEKCDKGIKCLEAYQREWNESLGTYRNVPLHNWACFTGDTKVLTHYGTRQIIDLPYTGRVMTPCGWKRYRNAGKTRANAQLVEVTFAGGTTVKCTPDHLFLTEFGWKSASDLTPGTLIQSSLIRSRSISMAGCTVYGLAKHILREAARSCIERCGLRHLEKFREIATFTTGTGTPATTHSTTWSAFQATCTAQNRPATGLRGSGSALKMARLLATRFSLIGRAKKPPNGTRQRPDGCGTSATPSEARDGRNGSVLKSLASSVERRLTQLIERADIRKGTAPSFAKPLRIESVRPLNRREDVYCLTVDDGHWFSLSNGAVVHNCHGADAFRHGAIGDAQTAAVRAQTVVPVSPKGWT